MVRRYNGKQHRKAAHDAVLSQQGANKNQGSLIWTLLLLGLVFCLFNFAFMFVATHFQTLSMLSSRIRRRGSTISTNGTAAEAATRQRMNDIVVPPEKERIFQILKDAHMDQDVTPEIMKELPTWQQVVDRLGPKPRIYGLDSCQTFKRTIPPAEAFIAPAGAFNSGTNLMAELLIANCFNPARRKKYKSDGVRWQVNWGKHQPPKYRVDQSVYKDKFEMPNENILPVVTIRDPYSWLQSMCRNRYVCMLFSSCSFCYCFFHASCMVYDRIHAFVIVALVGIDIVLCGCVFELSSTLRRTTQHATTQHLLDKSNPSHNSHIRVIIAFHGFLPHALFLSLAQIRDTLVP